MIITIQLFQTVQMAADTKTAASDFYQWVHSYVDTTYGKRPNVFDATGNANEEYRDLISLLLSAQLLSVGDVSGAYSAASPTLEQIYDTLPVSVRSLFDSSHRTITPSHPLSPLRGASPKKTIILPPRSPTRTVSPPRSLTRPIVPVVVPLRTVSPPRSPTRAILPPLPRERLALPGVDPLRTVSPPRYPVRATLPPRPISPPRSPSHVYLASGPPSPPIAAGGPYLPSGANVEQSSTTITTTSYVPNHVEPTNGFITPPRWVMPPRP